MEEEFTPFNLQNSFSQNVLHDFTKSRQSKDEQTYGIFYNAANTSYDERDLKKNTMSKGPFNFIKSSKPLIEPQDSKKVKVGYTKKHLKGQNKSIKLQKKQMDEDDFIQSDEEKDNLLSQNKSLLNKGLINSEGKGSLDMEEKYGKGWKMIKALGYKIGSGLGRNEQGRIQPIQAAQKRVLDGVATTSYNFINDERSGEEIINKDERDKTFEKTDYQSTQMKQRAQKREAWRKGSRNFEEVQKDWENEPSQILEEPIKSHEKVIDMRGFKEVIYSDLSDYTKNFSIPQAPQFRQSLIGTFVLAIKSEIEKRKSHILINEGRIKHERDKIITLNYEKELIEKEQLDRSKKIRALKLLSNQIKDFVKHSELLSLNEILEKYLDWFNQAQNEFLELNLIKLGVNQITKKLQTSSNLLNLDKDKTDFFNQFQIFLNNVAKAKEQVKYERYTSERMENMTHSKNEVNDILIQMFKKTWVPAMIELIQTDWNPKNPESLIDNMLQWEDFIPNQIFEEVVEKALFPKLEKQVQEWSPTSEKLLVHLWLHPWLPIIGMNKLLTLWKTIQKKVSTVLQQWHPKDQSLLILLKPWFKLFEKNSWEDLIVRCILPRILHCFKEFEVNPKKQNIEPVQWLIEWEAYVPDHFLAALVEKYILVNLKGILTSWKKITNANPNEINSWIEGWKDILNPLMRISNIKFYMESIESIKS